MAEANLTSEADGRACTPQTGQQPSERAAALTEELAPPAERGRTFIDDEVVSVIARIAAENVEGVHKLGESTLRAMFSGTYRHSGVASEVGMKEAAVDVEIVAEFGYSIRSITQQLRKEIIEAVERMADRRVVEVNVYVVDVHIGRVERRSHRELE